MNGYQVYSYASEQNKIADSLKAEMAKEFSQVKLDLSKGRPDIYYFILDGYASPLTMADLCGHGGGTSKEFYEKGFVGELFMKDTLTKFLAKCNFFCVYCAFANYDRTEFSLASSLNMQYLNNLVHEGRGPSPYVFMRLVQDSQFVRLLRSSGYRFILISSGAFGTDSMPQADRVMRTNYVNHFSRALAYITPWEIFEPCCPVLAQYMADTRLSPGLLLRQLAADEASISADQRMPKFVLIHTDLPHAPYVFDEHGGRLSLSPDLIPDWNPASAYYKQWLFCQQKVAEWLDLVLRASDGKAVIIVQSDHGPGMRENGMTDKEWCNERMRIFNAYYIPGLTHFPSAATSPVNNLRNVLNECFGTQLPILKSISYCPANSANTFDWHDVTEQLQFPKGVPTR